MKTLLIVDSSSLVVTLFYALGGQRFLDDTPRSEDEVASFIDQVVTATLEHVDRKVKHDKVTEVRLALESPPWAPVWRYQIYPNYKHVITAPNKPRIASRLQLPLAQQQIWPTVFSPRMEADDVVATMVSKAKALEGWNILVWSQDRDVHQAITAPNIVMLGKEGRRTTYTDVVNYWGVEPQGVPLIKALAGDPSDNIPGVQGVGIKTAAQLLISRPYRKPSPYWIDPSKLKDKKLTVLSQLNRVLRDEDLCVLKTDVPLIPGNQYNEATNGKS